MHACIHLNAFEKLDVKIYWKNRITNPLWGCRADGENEPAAAAIAHVCINNGCLCIQKRYGREVVEKNLCIFAIFPYRSTVERNWFYKMIFTGKPACRAGVLYDCDERQTIDSRIGCQQV